MLFDQLFYLVDHLLGIAHAIVEAQAAAGTGVASVIASR